MNFLSSLSLPVNHVSHRLAVTRYGYGRRFALIEDDVEKVTMILKVLKQIELA